MIDTCASEFESYIPYFYATYEQENESVVSDRPKIVVLGSGPIRIGQGVEFDYSTVHAVKTIKESGYEAIIINNNPETVSTDYTTSDKLYFEPLTVEDVMNVIELEKPVGVIASLGGQTAINLAEPLMKRGVSIIGTDFAAIEKAENRDAFEKVMQELRIPQPQGEAVTNIEDGVRVASRDRLSGAGAPQLRAGRPGHADCLRRGNAAGLSARRRGDQRGSARAGGQVHRRPRAGSGRGVRRHGRVRARHHGTGRAHGHPFRRFHQRLSHLLRLREGQGDHPRIHPPAGAGASASSGCTTYSSSWTPRKTCYVIEVNPRSSRTVPFLSKATRLAAGRHRHAV